ncbi:hypothetical protein JCM3765_000145 [Sporobolomyces pararoseus]
MSSINLQALSLPPPPSTSTITATSTTEQIPTLTSLLQATAESLISRTSKLPTSSSSTSSSSFTLPPNPTPQSLLSHPETNQYLSKLIETPLPSLLKLPSELSQLSNSLSTDLSTLSFNRYSSFLQSNDSSKSISNSFNQISNSLESLLESTLELEQTCLKFSNQLNNFKTRKENLNLVRDKLEILQELIDTPLVIKQCISQSQFNEALKVSQKVKSLIKNRYNHQQQSEGNSKNILLLDRLNKQVDFVLKSLKIKLLNHLKEKELKLPFAVKSIQILRKLNLFSSSENQEEEEEEENDEERGEEGLRIIFLSSRWKTLQIEFKKIESQMLLSGINLNHLNSDSPRVVEDYIRVGVEENDERTRWLKKWLEIRRELVGETISIYNEIFLLLPPKSQSSSLSSVEVDSFLSPKSDLTPLGPISLFISTSLESLYKILQTSLPYITSTASLSSILTQLNYCCQSFTKKFGLQFSTSSFDLAKLFSDQVERIVIGEFELAGKEWEKEWRQGWSKSGGIATTHSNSSSRRIKIKDWLIIPEGVEQFLNSPLPSPPTTFRFTNKQEEVNKWSSQPNSILSLIPPITHLLNSFTQVLNSLRLLPPVEIFKSVFKHEMKELERCSRVFEAFIDAWLTSFHSTTPTIQPSTFSPPSTQNGKEDLMSEEENRLVRERQQEKEIVLKSLGWFGRELLPWLRNSLIFGVYSELNYHPPTEEEEEEEWEGEVLLKEARKRCERLIERIQGREWKDPDELITTPTENHEGGTNGIDNKEEEEVPVLEVSTRPLDKNTSILEKEKPEEEKLSFNAESSTLDEPSLESIGVDENGTNSKEEEDPNAPYLVDEVAPPPPVPLTEELVPEAVEMEIEKEQNGIEQK